MAWVIIRAKQKGSWRPHWEGLLTAVAAVVPPDWKVIVTADQGLYADWLWTAIQKQGWHPLLRVNLQMGFRAEGEADFAAIGKRVQRRGRGWKGKGAWSETGARLQGTLLVRWEKGYEEGIAVVTDLSQEEVELAWYLMRFWIEDEYKDRQPRRVGMAAHQDGRPQAGRTAVAGDGSGDADRRVGGRAGRSEGRGAKKLQSTAAKAAQAGRQASQATAQTAKA